MSHGFLCKHCGFDETSHSEPTHVEDYLDHYEMKASDVREGFTTSFEDCRGYESEDPAAEQACINEARVEQQRRGEILATQGIMFMSCQKGSPPVFWGVNRPL